LQKGFIFDLDGTVYIDNNLVEGAAEAIDHLRKRGDKVVFLTNKSIETINEYVEKLNKLGIKATKSEVINSNLLVGRYLQTKMKRGEKVLVIGEKPLYEKLEKMNVIVTNDYREASYVVLGWDREFTYEKLNHAFQAWRNGAKIIATNPDRTCPVEDGQVPDCGAMIGAMEGATGEEVELILGKPSRLAAQFIVSDILKLPKEQCFIVGDRLETDIKMGNDYDLQSVLVMTGITTNKMLQDSDDQPTIVLDSIKNVIDL